MTAARARTQTTRSRVKCTNHEATAPPHIQQEKELNNEKKNTLTWSFRGQQLPKSEDNCSFIVPDYLQEKSLILI